MNDEEIIKEWRSGLTTVQVAKNYMLTINSRLKKGEKKITKEELKKIQIMMNNFSKKYEARIQVDTIKSINLETKEEGYIYDLKVIKDGD